MNVTQLIVFLLIGGVAGWLASMVMKTNPEQSTLVDVVVGVIGGVIGGYVFGLLNITTVNGWIGSLITSVVGAIILLALLRFLKKA